MSFERPDPIHQNPPPDYIDATPEATSCGQDAYVTTDIIPPDENSYSTDTLAEVAYPVKKPPLFIQVHHLGEATITGEHPDERVREGLDTLRSKKEASLINEARFLRDTPHRIHDHEAIYASVKEQLVRDFGPEIGDVPIIALSKEGTKQYEDDFFGKENAGAEGIYGDGQIIIFTRPWEADYGPDTQNMAKTSIALHEGAHASVIEGEASILTSRPLTEDEKNDHRISERERSIGYKLTRIYVGGFGEYLPEIDPNKRANSFWEEAFAESYSVRTKGKLGVPTTYDIPSKRQNYDKGLGTYHGLRLTDDERHTFYDATDGTIYLPWKYAQAAVESRTPGAPYKPLLNPGAYTACALDILDSKLPGLFDAMMQSRREPTAKQYVKDQINSVEAGLYERMGSAANNVIAAERRLIAILKKFNLADVRISDVLPPISS
jgi:hypothetical protein